MTRIPYSDFSPNYSIPAYSTNDDLSLCFASHIAYEKNSRGRIARTQIRNQTKEWGFSHVKCFEVVRGRDIDTQGYIAVNDRIILAAFRGTELLLDWLTHFQAVKVKN